MKIESVASLVYFFFNQQEKRLVAEIKRTAKTGNEAATRILARQLIRLRQQISNLQGSRAQIRGIATHTQVKCLFPLFASFVPT
jgi:division protein CdvB (Snf7/Vps24/ESCRT-III family)